MHIKDGIKSTWKNKDVSMAGLLASLLGPLWNMPPSSPTANTVLAFLYLPSGCWYPESGGVSASTGGGVRGAGREEWLLCQHVESAATGPDAPAEQGNVGVALSPSGSGSAPRADSRTSHHLQPEVRQLLLLARFKILCVSIVSNSLKDTRTFNRQNSCRKEAHSYLQFTWNESKM